MIRDIIIEMKFECNNKRVKGLIDSNKHIITKMTKQLDILSHTAFNNLFEMKNEVKGIKVEVSNDDHLFPNNMTEK